ncbi:MAG: endonuclease/exonuclease/phosphatase family protein [Moraxellaceae bacterium]|nr:endonuclease/exonuclease/phosphatase family protein [Moraxellaceae bacterium]
MISGLSRFLPAVPRHAAPPLTAEEARWRHSTLRLLSFNMQAGMGIHAPHHYVTRGLRHVLPHRGRHEQLGHIATLLADFDLVALQEVDGGSLRSGYTHQLAHLAERAGFAWWFQQLNRDLGHFGQFSNGVLSRQSPLAAAAHALPGLKGRGIIVSEFGTRDERLLVLNVHLALSQRARAGQFGFISELIAGAPHVVIMGDLNCTHEELRRSPLGRRHWQWLEDNLPTYPSWKPQRQIDHILVSSELRVLKAEVLPHRLSDHRPLAVELELPPGLCLPPAALTLPATGLVLL